jgi:hypothetical protein
MVCNPYFGSFPHCLWRFHHPRESISTAFDFVFLCDFYSYHYPLFFFFHRFPWLDPGPGTTHAWMDTKDLCDGLEHDRSTNGSYIFWCGTIIGGHHYYGSASRRREVKIDCHVKDSFFSNLNELDSGITHRYSSRMKSPLVPRFFRIYTPQFSKLIVAIRVTFHRKQ